MWYKVSLASGDLQCEHTPIAGMIEEPRNIAAPCCVYAETQAAASIQMFSDNQKRVIGSATDRIIDCQSGICLPVGELLSNIQAHKLPCSDVGACVCCPPPFTKQELYGNGQALLVLSVAALK